MTFHDVFRLKLELDYETPTAGMCPFSIDGISREPLVFGTGATSFRWRIPVNWPRGSLKFEAPTFTMTLIGEPVVQSGQSFFPDKRPPRVNEPSC